MSEEPNTETAAADAPAPPESATVAAPAASNEKMPAERRPAARGGGAGMVIGLLALLVALATAGGGFYAWQQIVEQVGAAGARIAALGGRIDRSDERITALAGADARLESVVSGLRSRQDDIDRRAGEIAAAVAGMQDLVQGGEYALRIAEALHLQRLATERLRLAGDVEGALAALEATDRVLAGLADPKLLPVREQLAIEMASLKAIAKPDIAGLSLRLERMIAGLDILPVRPAESTPVALDLEDRETAPWWERALDRVLNEVGRHVSVRRQEGGLLADEGTALLLRRLLALRLEAARVALLRRDEPDYRRMLDDARRLLADPFEPAAAAALHAEIDALAQVRLRPDLPDISGSYGLLSAPGRQPLNAGE